MEVLLSKSSFHYLILATCKIEGKSTTSFTHNVYWKPLNLLRRTDSYMQTIMVTIERDVVA